MICRGGGEVLGTFVFSHARALPVMNAQLLWLLAQDPAQMETFNIPLGMWVGWVHR